MITLQRQMNTIILMVIGTVVGLMTLAFFFIEFANYRSMVVANISPLAQTIGINLRPHLIQKKNFGAREILATLSADPSIEGAFLFDADNQPFSFYQKPRLLSLALSDPGPELLLTPPEIRAFLDTDQTLYRFVKGHFVLFSPVIEDEQKIGTLYLVTSLSPLYLRLFWWIVWSLPVMGMATLIGIALSGRLNRVVVAPVEQLAEKMRLVSGGENFEIRVEKLVENEIGLLVDGFNEMLSHLAIRDRLLEDARTTLEQRVRDRTQDLALSEARYRSLFEDSPISLWEQDFSGVKRLLDHLKRSGIDELSDYLPQHPELLRQCAATVKLIDVNRRTLALFSATDKTEFLENVDQIFTAESLHQFQTQLILLSHQQMRMETETYLRTLAGDPICVSLKLSVMPGYEQDLSRVIVSLVDITERKSMEQKLLVSLGEKEVLIKEVHHRVKNNLQVISSLISLQVKKLTDSGARQELTTILHRVRSIAMIHEQLYRTEYVFKNDFAAYVSRLTEDIARSLGADENAFKLEIDLDLGPMELPADMVISFGMIINELMTNVLKYGFPDRHDGIVRVSVRHQSGAVTLQVQDNGSGLPPDFETRRKSSLGFRLIDSMTRQFGGTIAIAGSNGTTVSITCPLAG